MLKVLEAQRTELTPFEQVRMDRLRAGFDGDLEGMYRGAKELLRLNSHPRLLYTAGWSAQLTNRQREAVDLFSKRIEWRQQYVSWYFMLSALHELGRHEEELEAAREARAAFPDDSHLLERELWVLAALGRLDEFKVALDEVTHQAAELRGRPFFMGLTSIYPGYAMGDAAVELQAHGHDEAPRELFARTIAFLESPLVKEMAGDPPAFWYRAELAFVLHRAGRWAEAVQLYEELLPEWADTMWASGMLGVAYARLDDREKALEHSACLSNLSRRGRRMAWQARIAAALGERERAVNLLQQAFENGENYGYLRLHKASELWPLRDYAPYQALMEPKG